jgi:hypothetical protein
MHAAKLRSVAVTLAGTCTWIFGSRWRRDCVGVSDDGAVAWSFAVHTARACRYDGLRASTPLNGVRVFALGSCAPLLRMQATNVRDAADRDALGVDFACTSGVGDVGPTRACVASEVFEAGFPEVVVLPQPARATATTLMIPPSWMRRLR